MTNSDKRNNRKTVILFMAVSMILCSLLIGAMKMKKDNEFLLSQVELKEQVFTAYKNEKGEAHFGNDQGEHEVDSNGE
jgi:hypothetical protein